MKVRTLCGMGLLLGNLVVPRPGLSLEWAQRQGYRWAKLTVPQPGAAGFTLVSPKTSGLTFTNALAQDRHLTNQIYLNGSGVACGDVNGDGLCDLYFCGLDGPNQLYRNRGDWSFEDVTAEAGVGCPDLDASGAAFADLDGDGDLDLIVNSVGGGTHCFFNDGTGHFAESPRHAPLNTRRAGMSLALADIDGDGALDLYLTNYRIETLRDQPNTRFNIRHVDGKPVVQSINGRPLTDPDLTNRFTFKIKSDERGGTFAHDENGEPDGLYRNDGQGNLTALSWTDGAFLDENGQSLRTPPFDWGLSVMFRDINGDGAPDLYVCNDFKSPDRIWINDGQGHFRAIAPLAIRQTCLSSMGVDFADINRDGYDDIFIVDMLSRQHERRYSQRIDIRPDILPLGAIENRPQSSRNTLLLNRGDGTYAEVAQWSGLEASEWSWTPLFVDVDLDGYEDLLISSGFERDGMNVDVLKQIEAQKKQSKLSSLEQLQLRRLFPRLATGPLAFRNLGNLKFAETSAAWGFHHAGVSQGMALADLDNDGDLDVAINNLNGGATLYRNNSAAPRIAVRLKGQAPNTRGIGAKIKVWGGSLPQSQEMICGGRYLSCDDNVRTFAAAPGLMRIEVRWRRGTQSVVTNALPNHIYEIEEEKSVVTKERSVVSGQSSVATKPDSTPTAVSPQLTTDNRQLTTPLFQDASHLLRHNHYDEAFDDFARQPLLPNRLSQLGPGVTWTDLNGDGWDDLIIASGRGGQLAAYRNDGHGGFQALTGLPFAQAVTRDQTTVLAWPKAPGEVNLLVGSANYEDGLAVGSSVRQYDLAGKVVSDLLPAQESSTGPLALADVDGDGNLDVFVGGRVVPGRYPQPASSLLFRGSSGGFRPDLENTKRLAQVGLVSGAVFSDIDGDGDVDLLLACEWGPIRVFRNEKGKLAEATAELGLEAYVGWWNGVTTGDFDGDGQLDIVASNWGQNTPYERFRAQPLRVYYGDLDGNGTMDVLQAYLETSKVLPLQPLHLIAAGMPSVAEQVPSCEAYAKASLEGIYGEVLSKARQSQANWLDTTVFLNRGNRFVARPLPSAAQMAPAFAACVGDADGDGQEDIFLSQNFFATQPETSRYDAGRGLWLRGDGQGGFTALPGQESGVTVYGEQRGAALCDFDGDGRLDLAVTQNGAMTKLYKNVGARPALRVRLIGPPGNPNGIGATVRLQTGQSLGPAREIHAGSGYWSQDSAVLVLAAAQSATHVVVRWPGGKTTTTAVPSGTRSLSIDTSGRLRPPP